MPRAADRGDPLRHALKHLTRQRILKVAAGQDSVYPGELSDTLDVFYPNVVYHVRVLAEAGALDSLGQVPTGPPAAYGYRFAVTEPWALELLGLADGADD